MHIYLIIINLNIFEETFKKQFYFFVQFFLVKKNIFCINCLVFIFCFFFLFIAK